MKLPLLAAVLLLAAGCRIVLRKDVRGGLPESLAVRRSHGLREVRYDLALDLRGNRIRGRLRLTFALEADDENVVLDFKAPKKAVLSSSLAYRYRDGHIAFRGKKGANELVLDFLVPKESLHREESLLYSLFVPDRASETFPCFDQPDVKGRFRLTLEHPEDWTAVSNAPAEITTPGKTVFAWTRPLPTYLFAFAAGRFSIEEGKAEGRAFRMLHLESDAEKIRRNAEAVYRLHARALDWLENYTALPYPFDKFDFVLLPAFPFDGMEHPGAVFYRAESVLLGEAPTGEELLRRASLISHETAHIWFGDLVTMTWFDDVWTKESFANFMADKIVAPMFPSTDFDLRFVLEHAGRAYAVDRSEGTHPLYQPLENLDEASELYGPIIYHKSPFALRQLELEIGPEAFRDGLRRHLKRRAYGNAMWRELLSSFETPTALSDFSRAWVETPGRATVETLIEEKEGRIASLSLRQTGGFLPQTIRLALDDERLTVRLSTTTTPVPAAVGRPLPRFVFANASGEGYGYFKLDPVSLETALEALPSLEPPVLRAALWESLYDAVLEGDLPALRFVDAAVRSLETEKEEPIVDALTREARKLTYGETGKLVSVFWRFLNPAEREEAAPRIEAALLKRLEGRSSSLRTTFVKGYRNLACTPDAVRRLEVYWRGELSEDETFAFKLDEKELTDTALLLAVLAPGRAKDILALQAGKTKDPVQRNRLSFLSPAASEDPAVREAFFESLKNRANRAREPWVLDGLKLLHHPLRAESALASLRTALDMLEEIKATGDIFFPQSWLTALLRGHSSPEAATTIRRFLMERPDLPARLRRLVLQAADPLLRAARPSVAR